MTVVLPWPATALSSNARLHWSLKANAVAKARRDAFFAAKAAGVFRDDRAVLRFAYHPPSRHHRDVQNMPAMLKASIDGIADAMGCDDYGFRPRFPDRFGPPRPGGAVIVTICSEED